jgi:hypothetical protein
VCGLANTSLRAYAYNLLYFVRWWDSIHHTVNIMEQDLRIDTPRLRALQSSKQPWPSASTVNDRVAITDLALRNEFRETPCQMARFGSSFRHFT